MGVPAPLGVGASGLPNKGDQANAVLSGVFTAVGPSPPFAIRGPMNLSIWNQVVTTLTITNGSLSATLLSATGITAGATISSTKVPNGATVGAISGTGVTLALAPVTFYCGDFSSTSANVSVPAGCNAASLVGATVTVPSTAEGLTLPASTTVLAVVTPDIAPSNNGNGVRGVIQLSAGFTVIPAVKGEQPLQFAVIAAAITATSGADAAATFVNAATTWDATVQLERSFDGGKTFMCCNIGGSGTLAQFLDLASINLTFGEPERHVLYRLNCTEYTAGTIGYRLSTTGEAATSLSVGTVI